MSNETHDDGYDESEDLSDDRLELGEEQSEEWTDAVSPTRDARGRWVKGHCPNPKGRPRKKPKKVHEGVDLACFSSSMVDLRINGEDHLIDKKSALYEKMFQEAMNGKVSMQKYLNEEIKESEASLAELRNLYDQMQLDWVIDHPDRNNPDHETPIEIRIKMERLYMVLHHYYPRSYPMPGKKASGG